MDIIIRPAANLGHLEELLVITQASDRMPAKEQQDLAQSAAEGAKVSRQRASDVLAERLPGLDDPNALPPLVLAGKQVRRLPLPFLSFCIRPRPCMPITTAPIRRLPASALTPGQAVVDPKYAPVPERS